MAQRDDPLRVGVIGYGLGGAAFHAPVIAATEGLAVTAIVTGNAERSAAARAHFPDATVVPGADRLWAMVDRLDAVVVTTPNRTHVPLATAALEAGLHVVVDKPLAPSAADARRLLDTARRQDRVLSVYQNRRWDGDFLTLRRLIADGELGDVYRFESRLERWRPVPKPGWRQDPAPHEAGGLLYDLGSHLIDQALVLFGPVSHVYAELDCRRPGAAVDDDTFLALTHESGVRSHLWTSAVVAARAPRFRVLGSRATWTKHDDDVQEARLRSGGDPGEPGFGLEEKERWGILTDGGGARPTASEPGDYRAFYAGLRRSIGEGAPPPVDPEDAVAGLEIIERARAQASQCVGDASSRSGRPGG
jgi:scyllo-inositol 2-dehydrogenase (NADP+)